MLLNCTVTTTMRLCIKKKKNRVSNQIKKSVFDDRCRRWQNVINRMAQSQSGFWKLVKIARKNKSGIKCLKINDEKFYDNTDIANKLAAKFAEAHSSFSSAHPFVASDTSINTKFVGVIGLTPRRPTAYFDCDSLFTIIASLTKRTAPGLDGISNVMIKMLPLDTIELICKIFNACFEKNYWPDSFKTASIVPIPKQGKNHESVDGYRASRSCRP